MRAEKLSKSGQEIIRSSTCPCFEGRKSILAIEPICWFCKYAGFDLKDDKLPERGVCCYPEVQEGRESEGWRRK